MSVSDFWYKGIKRQKNIWAAVFLPPSHDIDWNDDTIIIWLLFTIETQIRRFIYVQKKKTYPRYISVPFYQMDKYIPVEYHSYSIDKCPRSHNQAYIVLWKKFVYKNDVHSGLESMSACVGGWVSGYFGFPTL